MLPALLLTAANMDPGPESPACHLPWIKESPQELFERVEGYPGAVFLDSALAGEEAVSVIGFAPERIVSASTGNLDAVRAWLQAMQEGAGATGFPFAGGAAIGLITYEGQAEFGLYPGLLIYRHRTGEWLETGGLSRLLPPPSLNRACGSEAVRKIRLEPEITADEYLRRVRKAQEYIGAGDIYQVNLAHRFSAVWPEGGSGYALYPDPPGGFSGTLCRFPPVGGAADFVLVAGTVSPTIRALRDHPAH